MEISSKSRSSAPEIIDDSGPFKPSWLSECFIEEGKRMVREGIYHWQDGAMKPLERGTGPTIHVSKYGWAEKVGFRRRRGKEIEHFQIEFTHGDERLTAVHKEDTLAKFSIRYFYEFGATTPPREFERTELIPEDVELNEFFRDLTEAINPEWYRE